MSARLRGIARETEEIVAAGGYRASDGREVPLTAAVEAARAGTRMLGPDPVEVPEIAPADTRVEVTGESSLEAARRLADAPVAVLNFASALPQLSASLEPGGPPSPAAATSTAPRPRRKPCAAPQRCTRACWRPGSSTTTTGPTATRSTRTASSTHRRCPSSGTTGAAFWTSPSPPDS